MLREITIELTQQCPNSCLYCSSMSSPARTTMLNYGQIVRVIDDAIALGAKAVSLSGGEPFQHHDVLRIIDHIWSKGLQCLVYTSGIVLEQDMTPKSLPDEILSSIMGKVTKLIVNVEAADELTYNTIMGTNFSGFQLMQDTIRKAIAMDITVEAHVVPMKLNVQQLPKIIGLCSQMGIRRVSFLRLVVQGRASANKEWILLSDEETTFAKYLIANSAKENKSNIRLGIPFSDCTKRINCLTGIAKLDIRYDGKVYPCEAFKNDNLSHIITSEAESICDKTLRDIYKSSEYLSQTRQLLEKFQKEDTCETCMNQYYAKKRNYEYR